MLSSLPIVDVLPVSSHGVLGSRVFDREKEPPLCISSPVAAAKLSGEREKETSSSHTHVFALIRRTVVVMLA